MFRAALPALLVFASLAGCSSGSGSNDVAAPPVVTPPPPEPVPEIPLTDTLHFLDAPHMAGALPIDGDVIRTPVPSDVDGAGSGEFEYATWSLPRPALTEVRAHFRLVVEVQGVVTSYSYGIPSGQSCFWSVVLHFEDQDPSLGEVVTSRCIEEPPTVPTGVRELEFSLPVGNIESFTGEELSFSVYTHGIYSPGAAVEVLSGTVEEDSSLTIEELQLPIHTTTLL